MRVWFWSFRHQARRGHWPDVVELGGHLVCITCDKGSGRTRRIRPMQLQPVPWA